MTAILVSVGRAAIIKAIKDQPIHLAWGTGDPAWDTTPVAAPVGATALVNELGRRVVSQVQYCLPDPDGEIDVATGRFTISPTQTNYLYMRFSYDFSDEPTAVIRELGVFLNTVANESVPEGQQYLTPDQIDSPGTLFLLERTRLQRSNLVRQRFEYVFQA